jgi:hypothetical protein
MAGVKSLSEIIETQARRAERIALAVRPAVGLLMFGLFLFAEPAGPMVRILSLFLFLALGVYSLTILLLVRQGWHLADFHRASVIVDRR